MDVTAIRVSNINVLAERYGRAQLAARLGYDDTNYLNQLCAGLGSFGNRTARKIEKQLELQHGAMDRIGGVGSADDARAPGPPAGNYSGNVHPGPPMQRFVPVISSVRAGSWGEAADPYHPGEAEEWIPCPVKNYSERTYALRVEGDSMTSPYGKSYPAGSIVYVDPDQNGCVNGDRVIAKLPGQDQVVFKQLAFDGTQHYLKPLNPQHPAIFGEFRVIGKVIGKYEPE